MGRLIRFMILMLTLVGWSNVSFAQTNTCLPPTALTATNIGISSAILSWTPSNNVNQYYTVQYRPLGSSAWLIVTVQQFPYTLNNLQCGTNYEWQVQAYCLTTSGSSTASGYSSPASFSTLTCTNVCVAPVGLSATNITTNGATISWSAVAGATGYNVRYRIAGSAAWMTTTSTTNSINLLNLTCGSTYEVSVQTVCNSTAASVFSASITFVTQPCTINCTPPSGINVSNITTSNAIINWTPFAGGNFLYDIGYRVVGTTNQITIVNVTPPFTIANLVCNTNYEVRVRTNCGNNNYSAWSAFIPFSTLACPTSCPTPSGLTATNITSSGATLNWSASTSSPALFNIRYRPANTTAWITINNVSAPFNLAGAPCNSSIEWQVQTICANAAGTATLSQWSPSSYFTTTACTSPCPAPTGLNTTNISANAATANWAAVTGAPSYTVRRRVVGSTSWSFFTATSTSCLFGNLTCGTTYEWQVRANCAVGSNTNVNPYSPSITFTTTSCPTICPAPTQLTNTNITVNSAVLGWSNTGAFQYRVRYRVNVTGTVWTYLITSNTSTIINNLAAATNYVWQVQSVCSNTSSTANVPWSLQSSFTTLSTNTTCPPPSILNFTPGSTPGSLSVSWPAVPTAVSYTVRYRMVNTSTWTQSGTTNTYLLPITNLTPGATYEFQIQTVCATSNGAFVTGAWSGSFFYTMPLLLTVYPNPASEMISVSWQDEHATLVEIRDVFGVLVQSERVTSRSEMNVIEFSVSSLKDGWYSVTVYSNDSVMSSRFLKSSR